MQKPSNDIWNLAEHLSRRRRQIDTRYDCRCFVLPEVFAALIKAGRLSMADLEGLHEDKLAEIRRLQQF